MLLWDQPNKPATLNIFYQRQRIWQLSSASVQDAMHVYYIQYQIYKEYYLPIYFAFHLELHQTTENKSTVTVLNKTIFVLTVIVKLFRFTQNNLGV